MPARMPRRLLMLLCLAALAGGMRVRARTRSRESTSPRARASRSTRRAWTTTSSSRASSTPRSRRTTPTSTAPRREGRDLYGVFIQVATTRMTLRRSTSTTSRIKDNQGNEFEPEELPEDNQFAYHGGELLPDGASPRPAASRSWGPAPARCCSSGCRSRTPSTARWSWSSAGRGDDHLTFSSISRAQRPAHTGGRRGRRAAGARSHQHHRHRDPRRRAGRRR